MSSSQNDRAQRRRRILQAAVGAPVVLTLPNGAAAAAASLNCADKSQAMATDPGTLDKAEGIATAPDTWMRYRVQGYKAGSSKTPVFTLDGTHWYEVLATGAAQPYTLAAGVTPQVVTGKYYYVLVDYATYNSGAPISAYVYPDKSPVVNPIAGASCWNSLTGSSVGSSVIN